MNYETGQFQSGKTLAGVLSCKRTPTCSYITLGSKIYLGLHVLIISSDGSITRSYVDGDTLTRSPQ